jgi:iron complex outermembrane recepter protein
VHDPRIGAAGVDYYQNVGKANGYGAELETNFFLGDHVTLFVNPTYASLTYDEDLTFAVATLDTEDNQVVDTPEWMLKTGLILTCGDVEIVPMVRYLDKRYGDAENTEKIDEYVVADLKIGYTKKELSFIDALKISLELRNLFDEAYVSLINAMDDSRAGNTSYYVGAPFTTLLTVSLEI